MTAGLENLKTMSAGELARRVRDFGTFAAAHMDELCRRVHELEAENGRLRRELQLDDEALRTACKVP
jgi:hypothetical protein